MEENLQKQVTEAFGLMQQNQWKEALGLWAEIRSKDNNIAPAYIQAGIALRNLKQYNEALDLFNQSIRLHPQNTNNLVQKAAMLMELQEWEQAIDIWNEIRRKDSNIVPAYI